MHGVLTKLRNSIFSQRAWDFGLHTRGASEVCNFTSIQISCWRCQKPININQRLEYIHKYFCPCERKILLPLFENTNYYEVYNFATTYRIDNALLKSKYLKLQYIFHPDRFSGHSEQEQELAAEHSAIISTSYNTLSSTYTRAVYLLSLNGIDFEKDTITSKMSPEFLIQMFEMNEKLEEGMDESELSELKIKTKQHIEECYAQLAPAFDEKDYARAKDIVGRLQYFRNILIKIEEI